MTIVRCSKDDNTKTTTKSNKSLIAYTDLTIIDGVSSSVLTNHTLVVDTVNGTINDLFATGSKELSSEIHIKNKAGKIMMPGLIEGHFHLASGVGEDINLGKLSMQNMFQQGITTIRDMAGNGEALLALKRLGADKKSPYPKVHFACLVTGQDFIENDPRVAETAGSSQAGNVAWFRSLDDMTDVNALITQAKAFGCSGLKLYADINSSNAKRIIAAAKEQNFPVWCHGTLFEASPWDIAGAHSFSHADFFNFVTITPVPDYKTFQEDYTEVFDQATIASQRMTDYFDLLKQNNTVLDATLSVYEQADEDEQDVVRYAHAVTKAAYERKVKIGAGVDLFNDNIQEGKYSFIKELSLVKEVTNMTTMDALKTATINNAIATGIDKEYGSIEIGKKADLILLNQNPLDNLDHLKSIIVVIKDGVEHEIESH